MWLLACPLVGTAMGKRQSRPWIVPDELWSELWSLIEPLLPEPGPKPAEGRLRVPDRQALCGILLRVGRPRRRPAALLADRGYDHDKYRRLLWQRGIRPVIAERGQPHGSGLGIFPWVVERTISWLHGFHRLPSASDLVVSSLGTT